jgi:hypothetical protein
LKAILIEASRTVGSDLFRLGHDFGFHVARQKNHREIAIAQDQRRGLGAVDAGSQVDVHEDQVDGGCFGNGHNGILTGMCDYHVIAVFLQGHFFGHGDDRFIVHQQDRLLLFSAHVLFLLMREEKEMGDGY